MPNASKRACPKCYAVLVDGRCPRCEGTPEQIRQRDSDRWRGSARERGYTREWEIARARYLAEHPLCAACLKVDRVTEATVVDHVVPHEGNLGLFWDRANWQSLCVHCHGDKTARESNAKRRASRFSRSGA